MSALKEGLLESIQGGTAQYHHEHLEHTQAGHNAIAKNSTRLPIATKPPRTGQNDAHYYLQRLGIGGLCSSSPNAASSNRRQSTGYGKRLPLHWQFDLLGLPLLMLPKENGMELSQGFRAGQCPQMST